MFMGSLTSGALVQSSTYPVWLRSYHTLQYLVVKLYDPLEITVRWQLWSSHHGLLDSSMWSAWLTTDNLFVIQYEYLYLVMNTIFSL